jgi:hypothetical protein
MPCQRLPRFGLHYGYRTPLVLLFAQTGYGVIVGIGFARFFS